MSRIKNAIKFIVKKSYRWQVMAAKGYYNDMDDAEYIRRQYYARFGGKKKLDLEDPKTLCEKLNWLKIYDRKPRYTAMVDKYAVKKFVSDLIGEEYVIPALGVWDTFEEIDLEQLPEQFVLKCTHDSGSIVVCTDKATFDRKEAGEKLNAMLRKSHYKENREWVYKNVVPRIIAEPYIDTLGHPDSVEYKITCFGGTAKFTTVCTGIAHDAINKRTNDHFDRDFKPLNFYAIYKNSGKKIKKPEQLDDMIRFSEILSQDVPYLRVDWYLVDGKIYFGEMTFYTWAGYMQFQPDEWDLKLGSWLTLPEKTTES